MQANIIPENIVFNNCYSGTEFENKTVDFLRLAGLTANRVGKANDGGIDIEASVNIQGVKYSYYIQCKYYNKPLGKGPNQLPRCKHSSTVSGSYVASHST
jgi:hypothetical protein